MQRATIVDRGKLGTLVKALFVAAGVPINDADIVSNSLVEANTTGVDSHGAVRVKVYLDRWKSHLIHHGAVMKWLKDDRCTAVLDADNCWGQVAAHTAMEKSIEKAKQYGVGMVVVRNSNHIGACSFFTKMAARAGCIGIASTNSSAIVAASGTAKPTLGTNPLAISVPTSADGASFPVTLDMATSEVARGKIIVAAKEGKPIPSTWALNKDGHPTTNAEEAMFGSLLPFGGIKGSGLSMMLDILTGVLSGARFGVDVGDLYSQQQQGLGHFFAAIDVSAFIEPETFYRRMHERIRMTKAASGDGSQTLDVYMPGEIEELTRRYRLASGIPLDSNVYDELKELANAYHLAFDL